MSKKSAFTLIEVIIAITIVTIITGFVIVQMNNSMNTAKDAKKKADIEMIWNAISSYRAENYSNAPTENVNCSVGDCSSLKTSLDPYLQTLPDSPDSIDYVYRSDGTTCVLYATLSDGSIYRRECTNELATIVYPVNGKCGGDNGSTQPYTYVINEETLCDNGTSSGFGHVTDWFWSCDGINEGITVPCRILLSNVFTCSIKDGNCGEGEVDMFHIYDQAGGHAELNNQSTYSKKVCCIGAAVAVTNITDGSACPINSAAILNLYDATKSHVEKGSENNYINKVCLSSAGRKASCVYTAGSECQSGFTKLVDISDGETSLHVGSGAFSTSVCCKIEY